MLTANEGQHNLLKKLLTQHSVKFAFVAFEYLAQIMFEKYEILMIWETIPFKYYCKMKLELHNEHVH